MSRFKKVLTKKAVEGALSKHPLVNAEESIKKDYVKGLVFIAIEDGNFSEEEKTYILALMKNISLDESLLSEFESFASEPDEDELLAFMDRLKAFEEDLKVNFLIEVVCIAFKDGNFDEKEQSMFDDYLEFLEIQDKKDDIMYISLALVNKDIDLALSLYTVKKEFLKKYDYMFEILNINIEKELSSVYDLDLFELILTEGELSNNARYVMKNPVTNRQFCIFLNGFNIKNKLLISEDHKGIYHSKKRNLLMYLNYSDIEYDDIFKVKENDKMNNKITGMTYACIYNFVEWINTFLDYKVSILKINIKGIDNRIEAPIKLFNNKDADFRNEIFCSNYYASYFRNSVDLVGVFPETLDYSSTYCITKDLFTISGRMGMFNSSPMEQNDWCSSDSSFRLMKIEEQSREEIEKLSKSKDISHSDYLSLLNDFTINEGLKNVFK